MLVDIRKSERHKNKSGRNELSLLVCSKIVYLKKPRESAKMLFQISVRWTGIIFIFTQQPSYIQTT